MEVVNKPSCKFGAKCYRKNAKHFDIYSHPELSDTKSRRSKVSHDRKQVSKNIPSKSKKREPSSVKEEECKVAKEPKILKDFEHKDVCPESELDQTSPLDLMKEGMSKTKKHSSLECKTVEEIIKTLFLFDMPPDFYSFYQFYKNVIQTQHLEAFQSSKLKLVGPFDVLSENINYSAEQDLFLCHWRFYYDPPEFQTVLATHSGFHIGYWRDDPSETPVFLASNDPNKGCQFKMEAGNIFASVFHHLTDFLKTCDPFQKVKITKLQAAVRDWAKENKFSLEKKTEKMAERQKKVVSKTFHGMGIVVPVDEKTEVGYRPLIETDENLKKICNLIMKASDDAEKESLWEKIQALITAANIANDECDFGNSLELGIDLFCAGSPVFHETVKHLLCTAYSLLDRSEFEKIVEAHLKFRRKDNDLGICN